MTLEGSKSKFMSKMYVGRGWIRTNYVNTLIIILILINQHVYIIIPRFMLLNPEGKQVSQTGEQKVSPGRMKLCEPKDPQCFRRHEALSEFSLSNCICVEVSKLFACLDFKITCR